MYVASKGQLLYIPSIECVVSWTIHKTYPVVLNIFWLCHAHVRKDTRLSQLVRTASDGKLGGAWERSYSGGWLFYTSCLIYIALLLLQPQYTDNPQNIWVIAMHFKIAVRTFHAPNASRWFPHRCSEDCQCIVVVRGTEQLPMELPYAIRLPYLS